MKLNLGQYTNHRAKVSCRDGRWIEGTILATDANTNTVLDDAEEFRSMRKDAPKRRTLGLVVLRGDFIVDVEILSKPVAKVKQPL
jgi:small nuclear ribonucleoprotein B and B'